MDINHVLATYIIGHQKFQLDKDYGIFKFTAYCQSKKYLKDCI